MADIKAAQERAAELRRVLENTTSATMFLTTLR